MGIRRTIQCELRSRDGHGCCTKKPASIVVDFFIPGDTHLRIPLFDDSLDGAIDIHGAPVRAVTRFAMGGVI